MRRLGWVWVFGLALTGCSPTVQERMREYNTDGVYLYERGQFDRARESFEAALLLAPEDVGLLYNIGQCHARMGNTAKAEYYYGECLARSPNHAACRHALAGLLVRDGRWPEAVRMVQDWLVREPKLAAAYAQDGWLWRQAGDLPRAQARLQQALELDPHDERALTELASIYEEMQRPDRALVLYERLLARDPQRPELIQHVNRLLAQGVGRPKPE